LLLDLGNFLSLSEDHLGLKAELIMKSMSTMGYTLAVLGANDYYYGEELVQTLLRYADFPVVSTNIRMPEVSVPSIVNLEAQGMKIAVLNVTHPDRVKNVADKFLQPPLLSVQKQIHAMNGRHDLVILLTHMDYRDVLDMTASVKGLSLVIAGGSAREPVRLDDTLIVTAGKNAEALAVLDLVLDPESCKVRDFSFWRVPLNEDVEPDTRLKPLYKDYEAKKREKPSQAGQRSQWLEKIKNMTPEEYQKFYQQKMQQQQKSSGAVP